jgi:hypothetical protein
MGKLIERNETAGRVFFWRAQDFSPEDVFMLWEGLMASKYISSEEMRELVKKLSKYTGGELRLGTAYYGGIIKRYTYPETLVYGNLKFILTEMAVNKKIVFKYNKYNADKALTPLTEAAFRVNPHAIVNVDNEYYLAASVEGATDMSCYKVGLISDLESTEFLCEDIRTVLGYDKGFDSQRFVRENVRGFGGTVTDCIVKVQENILDEVIAYFGEDFKVIQAEDGTLTLDITTCADKMYDWALVNAN